MHNYRDLLKFIQENEKRLIRENSVIESIKENS